MALLPPRAEAKVGVGVGAETGSPVANLASTSPLVTRASLPVPCTDPGGN